MWNAICKYGWENVKHEIIASNLTKEEAENFEILLIDKLKSNQRDYGYNIANGGQTCGSHSEETIKKMSLARSGDKNPNYGKKFSEEHRKKISETHKGLLVGEKNPAAKAVVCIETQQKFPTMKSASIFANCCKESLSQAVRNPNRSAGGYHWKYA